MQNLTLAEKLKSLPKEPGVYFHKNISGEIIYVSKAAVLRNRVRQYFQKSRSRDIKTENLVCEIYDTDWMVVGSELEALFLESEMIRRYMPKYNILLRDDKSLIYIKIDYDSSHPTVTTTRRPLDDGARYFGPYLSSVAVRRALKILRKIFPYSITKNSISVKGRVSLYYHIGLDPGLEEGRTTLAEYKSNLRRLIAIIEGRHSQIIKELTKDMNSASSIQDFERAALIRNQIIALTSLNKQIIFSDSEFLDISKDHALNELVNLLGLPKAPFRIEGYDVSHMQGSDVVASMVIFTNGVSNKAQYRKFKTKKDHNNDFYNMNETITRRLSAKNIKAWGIPDLVIIDGGKGQLSVSIKARDKAGMNRIPFIGLAKREEQIVIQEQASNFIINGSELHRLGGYTTSSEGFITLNIPHNTNIIKLLQRIRDESHRFAVSYHSVLKQKRQTSSILEEIPGIGPVTKKLMLKKFGSLAEIKNTSIEDLEKVVGNKKAILVKQYLDDNNEHIQE